MRKKKKERFNKIKKFFRNLNDKFFFGKYKTTYKYINKESNLKEYIIKFLFIYSLITCFLFLLFNSILFALGISIIVTIFFLNEVVLNAKKISYETYILSQLTIYTSQVSLLVSYNNIYSSLNEVVRFLDYPVKNEVVDNKYQICHYE